MTLRSAALLALASAWLHTGAAHAGAKADVELQAIIVVASGRGSKATYDSRIPAAFRKQLQGCRLSYTKYDLIGHHRNLTAFGAEIRVGLPDKASLTMVATRHSSKTHPVRIDCRVHDPAKKSPHKIQTRVPYGRTFLIHRPKGPAAVIVGVSAHKPPTR